MRTCKRCRSIYYVPELSPASPGKRSASWPQQPRRYLGATRGVNSSPFPALPNSILRAVCTRSRGSNALALLIQHHEKAKQPTHRAAQLLERHAPFEYRRALGSRDFPPRKLACHPSTLPPRPIHTPRIPHPAHITSWLPQAISIVTPFLSISSIYVCTKPSLPQ